jgi:dTDP-4-dehydrorhamnose 3,5-epimerase-like enzyme
MNDPQTPHLIPGVRYIDDRGCVDVVNDFHFEGVKRHYVVHNHKSGFVRAWHGHKIEAKYFTMARGSAIVAAVKVEDWDHPDGRNATVYQHILSAEQPRIFYIPPGYANGWMSLTEDTTILIFSTTTFEESKGDDYRFPARLWDVWSVGER